ncbi:hypothetical protein DY000_02034350 [Brassica cretica]|uniref:Uncharacterized protein n=1 Tax=Brassica cretica TaxID=69181 RepID=A0ABQ7E0L7_BRACR|nr:hypothetical protein DY000_02034350 [Brassica cretica]
MVAMGFVKRNGLKLGESFTLKSINEHDKAAPVVKVIIDDHCQQKAIVDVASDSFHQNQNQISFEPEAKEIEQQPDAILLQCAAASMNMISEKSRNKMAKEIQDGCGLSQNSILFTGWPAMFSCDVLHYAILKTTSTLAFDSAST